MKPRDYLATFMTLAVTAGLPFGAVWSIVFASAMGRSFGEVLLSEGLPISVAFGTLVGGIMASKLRAITISLPVGQDRDAFLSRVTLGLAEIGYHPDQPIGNAYTFRPSVYAGRAAGRITVVVEPRCSDATALGPRMHVRALFKLLREGQSSPEGPSRG